MLRAIGLVIVLWYISHVFAQTFSAADTAGRATFEALETAAMVTQKRLE